MKIGETSVRAAYRTRAVIDWIELAVTLENETQFRYVQKRLQTILELDTRSFVRPVDPGAGNVAKRFTFCLHDGHAATLGELERIMAVLALAFPFAAPPEITNIELALDFYPKLDLDNIPSLVHRLQSSIEARCNPRQFDPDKAPKRKHCNRFLNPDRPEPVTGLTLDARLNLRIGNKGDPIQRQIYDKRTDNNGQPVAPGKRRARAEFTLTGSQLAWRALGPNAGSRLVTLDDLRTFRFETLANFLHFRQLKPIDAITNDPIGAATLATLDSLRTQGIINYGLGMTAYYRDRRRPNDIGREATRKHSGHTVADAELNDIVRRSFKALTGRFA